MNPQVSVIFPTYNRLRALKELLVTLELQTFQDFEVIIVNDYGESPQHIVQLFPQLSIRLIELDHNVKHVKARNIALEHAIGEYIMLMDDDDLLVPQHMERMIAELQDSDMVFCDAEVVELNVTETGRIPVKRDIFAYEFTPDYMRTFSTYIPSGSMYRRSIHDEIGEFDESVHNYWDWDFMLTVSTRYKVKRVPCATLLYAVSVQGDNQSANLTETRNNYLSVLCEKHQLGELPQKNFWLLLQEPEMLARKANTERVWDGIPFWLTKG